MTAIETYRGTVYRWEVDNVDHFTVAFYFARFEDATLALLQSVGLDPRALGGGVAWTPLDCDVRYRRELRMGDIFHVRSGVTAADGDALGLLHEVVDSGDGTVCTVLTQTIALAEPGSRARRALTASQRAAALIRRVDPPTETRPAPPPAAVDGDAGFVDAALDAVRPAELNAAGELGLPGYIHRFSGANAQLLGAFGMTPEYLREEHRGFSTFEFRLRFFGTLRVDDLVRVRTGLLHIGNSSIRILHRLTDARTGDLVATLEQAGVHLDLDARRPAPLPGPLRERALAMVVGR